MGRKKEEEAPQGSPAWMSTFSDLMNLLLCFFVMLFAMSSMDKGKYMKIVESFKGSSASDFSIMKNTSGESVIDNTLFPESVQQTEELDAIMSDVEDGKTEKKEKSDTIKDGSDEKDGKSVSQKSEIDEASAEAVIQEKNKRLAEKLYADVTQDVDEQELGNDVDVAIDSKYQYVKLTLSGAVLFESGESFVKSSSKNILSKVAIILKNYKKSLIKIEGHTDNVPMTSGKFRSNMELSSARAYSVWSYMTEEKGLNPKMLESSGRSEYDPIADNSTSEGRAKNRRVEFKIYTDK